MNLKKKILAFLSSEEPTVEVVTLAEEKLENGTIVVADEFKAGVQVFIKSEDEGEENVALPVGEYEMENGSILCVEVEGEIYEIKDNEEEKEEEESEEPSEQPEEMKEEDEESKMEDEDLYAKCEMLAQAMVELEARLSALEGPQEELTEEVVAEELSKEEEKEEEEVKPVVHTPEAKEAKKVKFYFPKN